MKTFNIGRNASNDIVLDDKMVSRQHAQLIVLENGQIIIKDLGSSNGTFVNGNRTSESQLKAGDIVKCGTSFVKWSQYKNEGLNLSPKSDQAYNQNSADEDLIYPNMESRLEHKYSLGKSLKYLATKIFNADDLFKSEWDRTPSILFFFLTPAVIILFISLYFYGRTQTNFIIERNFSYQILLPLLISVFVYGVSQMITLSLLSINRDTTLVKVVFASSIVSFLQFLVVLIVAGLWGIFSYLNILENGNIVHNIVSWHNYYVIIFIVTFTFVSSLTVTLLTFIYKYFRIIGTPKGVSLHLTILTISFNLLLQLGFTYFLISITAKNLLNF